MSEALSVPIIEPDNMQTTGLSMELVRTDGDDIELPEVLAGQRDINGRDGVSLYLEEIARTPLLDAEQEVELSKAIEAGMTAKNMLEQNRVPDWTSREELEWLAAEGDRAFDLFYRSNLRLVVSIARKYSRSRLPMLDVIQEGNAGLIRAVEKFDYTKGYKFSTYATWWIRQAMTRGIAQQGRLVRLPVHVEEEVNQLAGVKRTMERQLGREVEPEELATELGVEVARVIDLMAWSRDHSSLDAPIGDDGDTSFGDLISQSTAPSPEQEVIGHESNDILIDLLSFLDDRKADIIRRRYGIIGDVQQTYKDIGIAVGISGERVRQLEREALEALKFLAQATPDEKTVFQQEQGPKVKSAPLGARAKQRLELRRRINSHDHALNDEQVAVLLAYINASSYETAAKTFGISTETYAKRFRLAKAALFLVASEEA